MTRHMRVIGLVLAMLCLCAASVAVAQDIRTSPQGIQYLSGGFGTDEQAAMEAMAQQFNLKLMFAQQGGSYLADVRVSIRGPANLEAVSEGPWFYAKLPAGTYQVTAVNEGKSKTQTVRVDGAGRKSVVFRW